MSILAVNTNGFPLTVVKVMPRIADTIVMPHFLLSSIKGIVAVFRLALFVHEMRLKYLGNFSTQMASFYGEQNDFITGMYDLYWPLYMYMEINYWIQ